MKKKSLLLILLCCLLSLSACSVNNSKNAQSATSKEKITQKNKKVTSKEFFDTIYDEYNSFEWVNSTEWEENQEIKVSGKLIEARTQDDYVYCEIEMASGEVFYGIINKEDFNKKPVTKGKTITLAGIAFGNNKDNIDVDTDAVYVKDYSLYQDK